MKNSNFSLKKIELSNISFSKIFALSKIQYKNINIRRERLFPFILSFLLVSGIVVSGWTLKIYTDRSGPIIDPPDRSIIDKNKPGDVDRDGSEKGNTGTRGDYGDYHRPCQKPSKIQFDHDPTIKERARRGLNQLEQYPDIVGVAGGAIAGSLLALTAAPGIALAALGVVTWLFIRGALGAC